MDDLLFLIGRTRGARERVISTLNLQKNALGQVSLLRIVPNRRSLRDLDQRSAQRQEFFPHGQVLSDWLASCGRERLGQRSLLSPQLLGYRLVQLATERSFLPESAALLSPHELGTHLASAYRLLREHLHPPEEFPVNLLELFEAFDGELAREDQWITLEGAMREAAKSPQWAQPPTPPVQAILLDTPESLSSVQRRLLVRSVSHWLQQGQSVVVTFSARRSLGSEDVFQFFDSSPSDQNNGAASTSSDPARSVRRALFQAFLQEGTGQVVWCGETGEEILEIEKPRTSVDEVWITDEPESASPGLFDKAAENIQVFEPSSEWEEVHAIGADLKRLLIQGELQPENAVIAVPELPRYAPLVLAMAEDLGLPVDLSSAAHLVRHPVGTALAALLRLSLPSAKVEDYFDLIAAAPIRKSFSAPPEQALSHLRSARVRRSWPTTWLSDLVEWNTSQPNPVDLRATRSCIESLIALDGNHLQPIRRSQTPLKLLELLAAAIEGLGFPSSPQDDSGEAAGAWKAVLTLLQDAEQLAHQLPRTDAAKDWLVHELQRSLRSATFRTSPPQPEAIRVLGALELRGIDAEYLWFAGLTRGAYPASRSPHPLVPSAAWRAIQAVSPSAEAHSQLHTLLRTALSGALLLRLSWPQMRDGKTCVPAPPLREFLDRFEDTDRLLSPIPQEPCFSKRLQLLQGNSVDGEQDELLGFQAKRRAQRRQPFGRFDGETRSTAQLENGVSVTRLERYIHCPARDWYERVLKLDDSASREEDATPMTTGSLLHKILEVFVERNMDHYRSDDVGPSELAKRLASVANEVLDTAEIQPSLSEDGLADLRQKWLPGLVDKRPKGVLATWLDQEMSKLPERYPIRVEAKVEGLAIGEVPIRGRVDRVDGFKDKGSLIIDYKSGTTPSIADLREGVAIQGLLYSEWARRQWTNRPLVGSVYALVGKADDMREKAWMGDAEVLEKTPARSKFVLGEAERNALLEHVGKAIKGLQKGIHHPTLEAPAKAGCDRCAYHRICRFDEERSRSLAGIAHAVGPMEAE